MHTIHVWGVSEGGYGASKFEPNESHRESEFCIRFLSVIEPICMNSHFPYISPPDEILSPIVLCDNGLRLFLSY